ncbi:hypothetical protein DN30_3593 [Vibrio cholerae]|nr:hypothetical protein DN30_3593 [Vibrio cholerae]
MVSLFTFQELLNLRSPRGVYGASHLNRFLVSVALWQHTTLRQRLATLRKARADCRISAIIRLSLLRTLQQLIVLPLWVQHRLIGIHRRRLRGRIPIVRHYLRILCGLLCDLLLLSIANILRVRLRGRILSRLPFSSIPTDSAKRTTERTTDHRTFQAIHQSTGRRVNLLSRHLIDHLVSGISLTIAFNKLRSAFGNCTFRCTGNHTLFTHLAE